ncbi:MAG: RNA 2',3'-cyclic phosphodiesterase [Acidobacteria bacterium]|nr:RNA 2',3'-cyclic phosphodiesterase [Acidobacteriota bacterium]
MRLFVALDLTDAVRAAIAELLAGLKPTTGAVRWVQPDVLHLTVKFIGHLGEEKLPALREALARVGTSEPVELEFHGVGFFPNPRSPRVFWVGVRSNDALFDLAGQIEAALEPLGIARERRAYAPHLTLGRFKSGPGKKTDAHGLRRLQEKIAALPSVDFGHVRCEEFFLYQSKLSPGGAKYSKLERFGFIRTEK